MLEYARSQDIAAHDRQRRGGCGGLGLFDNAADAADREPGRFNLDNAVFLGVAPWHVFYTQHAAAMKFVGRRHLLQTGHLGIDKIIGKMHKKGLLAHCGFGAQHGVAQTQRRRLADIDTGGIGGQHAANLARQVGFTLRLQQLFEFLIGVEMIFNGALGSAGDEYQALRAGSQRLLDGILDEWLIDHRQHFLGTGFGGRQESRAATGHRENGGSDLALHGRMGLQQQLIEASIASVIGQVCIPAYPENPVT